MSDRRRLARDPLADLLATTAPEQSRLRAGSSAPRRKAARITVQLEAELAEQVRDAIMWLHKVDVHTTISAIAEAGLRTELERLAQKHNHGEPFPPRSGEVPTGRPPRV